MNLVPQYRPEFDGDERRMMQDYLDHDSFLTEFKQTKALEVELSNSLGVPHVCMVANGTLAITLAALSLGLAPGDKVICPNYTMIATVNALKLIGCEIVLCDVEYPSLWIDYEQLKEAITSEIKAVVFVSANGRYPSYDPLDVYSRLRKQGICVIEDAAQSLGSTYRCGRAIGSLADVATLSFSTPKIVSTGQGGAVFSNSPSLIEKVRKTKDFGRVSGGNDLHDSFGINCKFTDLQAIIGLAQMKDLDRRIERKKHMFRHFIASVANPKLQVLTNDLDHTAPWFFEVLSTERSALANFLLENGFSSRAMYPPINSQKCIEQPGTFPVSEKIGREGLWVPCWPGMTDDTFENLISTLNRF